MADDPYGFAGLPAALQPGTHVVCEHCFCRGRSTAADECCRCGFRRAQGPRSVTILTEGPYVTTYPNATASPSR